MTSRHCFFSVMKEDLRHKTWMLALSVLGNLLALPVLFLLGTGGGRYSMASSSSMFRPLDLESREISMFFGMGMSVSCGVVAVVGALIVGLFGFRFLFRRNMVDTWHSMPVSRRVLFAVGWLNGFLIWFVPFLANLLVTMILGGSRLSVLKKKAMALPGLSAAEREVLTQWPGSGSILRETLLSVLGLTIAFLVAYHLTLLAVVLCGNLLNALVTVAVLGSGALSVWGILQFFQMFYWDTFLESPHFSEVLEKVLYASPLASSIYVLCRRVWEFTGEGGGSFAAAAVWNLAIAAGMGVLAWYLYERRPSELSEQGLRNKPVKFLIQTVVSVVAALGGWMLFSAITGIALGNLSVLGWCIFGALLVGIVVFGTLDIIFQMDFKAFFSHKIWMAATMLASLLIGFAFRFDWMGHDTWLPAEEDIAEIAVYDASFANRFYRSNKETDYPLEQVHIENPAAAAAFLQSAVDYLENGISSEDMGPGERVYLENLEARVTLKNGRSYYRTYTVSSADSEPAYALLTTPEYLNTVFRLGDTERTYVTQMTLERGRWRWQVEADNNRELINEVFDAYNRDLEENPDVFIRRDGRLLAQVRVELGTDEWTDSRYLEVFEEMHHTVEALCRLGFDDYVMPPKPEDVGEIRLGVHDWNEEKSPLERARETYRVYDGNTEGEEAIFFSEDVFVMEETGEEILVSVTDPAEIEELLELFSFAERRQSISVFCRKQAVRGVVTVVGKDGSSFAVTIPEGALPEKYILRFSEL